MRQEREVSQIKGDYQATLYCGWMELISLKDTHLWLIPIDWYGSWDIYTLTPNNYRVRAVAGSHYLPITSACCLATNHTLEVKQTNQPINSRASSLKSTDVNRDGKSVKIQVGCHQCLLVRSFYRFSLGIDSIYAG